MKNKHLILLLTIFLSVILIGCKVPNEIELNNHQFYNAVTFIHPNFFHPEVF